MPVTMHEMFWRQVAAHPDRVAVVCRGRHVSYQALGRRASAWTSRLRAAAVAPGDLVGVHLERSEDLVAAMLGALSAGAAYVPLDPAYPRDRLEYMVADAGMAALISADPTLSGVPVIDPADVPPTSEPGVLPPMHGEHLAYVLYTSGSTGKPKGVAINHANAVDLLEWSAATFGTELERVLATTSVCFDCSILEIFGPLSTGGTTVVGSGPADIADGAHAASVRLLHTVPSVVADLMRTDRLPGSVTTAIVGGEALLPAVVERVYAGSNIERLVNLYGPTEYTSYATMAVVPRSPEDHAVPPIGHPVANTDIHLLTDSGRADGVGTGEIAIAGAGLVRGYLGKPALTAERFVPEPFSGATGGRMYRTGDLGHRDVDGVLFYLGRIDDQIKHRGVRIEPAEIEQALLSLAEVDQTAVVQADVLGRSVLAAYVVSTAFAGDLDGDEVRARLRETLPAPMVPEVVTVLPRLPRTPNGKLDRAALPPVRLPAAAPCASAESSKSAPSPRSAWVPVLGAMWAEAIGVAEVNPAESIFDMGGHSLTALRVRNRIGTLLGEDPPARLLFDAPTVLSLADELDRRYGPPPTQAIKAVEPAQRSGQLSPTQRAVLDWVRTRPDAAELLLPLVVRIRGEFDLAALRQALAALQRRHDILRTVLRHEPGSAPRLVAGDKVLAVPLLDFNALPAAEAEQAARRIAEWVATAPMSLTDGPPVRMALLRLGDGDVVLAMAVHRIAADAWSMELISQEILEGYATAITGDSARAALSPQYADWAAEQVRVLTGAAGRAQLAHWTATLAGATPLALEAAVRTAELLVPTRAFAAVSGETVALVDRLARAERATPFMIYVAAYAALLSARTGQADVVVGCPTAGRDHPGLTDVVGPCAEAFAVRCDLGAARTFRELVGQVRENVLDAFGNADVPFAALAAELGRGADRHPVHQAAIVVQQGQSLLNPNHREDVFGTAAIGAVDISPFVDFVPGTALDVELMLFPREDDVEVVLDCRPDAVAPGEVAGMAEQYVGLLDDHCRAPDLGWGRSRTGAGEASNRKT